MYNSRERERERERESSLGTEGGRGGSDRQETVRLNTESNSSGGGERESDKQMGDSDIQHMEWGEGGRGGDIMDRQETVKHKQMEWEREKESCSSTNRDRGRQGRYCGDSMEPSLILTVIHPSGFSPHQHEITTAPGGMHGQSLNGMCWWWAREVKRWCPVTSVRAGL